MSNLSIWQLVGFTFTAVLGTVLHFLFDWTGVSFFTPISAVNESTWEHMKILFFPMLFFAIIQHFIFAKNTKNFWWIKLIGIVIGVTSVPVLFYTYNGCFGQSPDWLNILFFFISAGSSFLLEFYLFKLNIKLKKRWIPITVLSLISLCFIIFTFISPKLPIFQDPLSGLYGII